jgi:hypothetical protein
VVRFNKLSLKIRIRTHLAVKHIKKMKIENINTLGELKASGYQSKSIKENCVLIFVRENKIRKTNI